MLILLILASLSGIVLDTWAPFHDIHGFSCNLLVESKGFIKSMWTRSQFLVFFPIKFVLLQRQSDTKSIGHSQIFS